ncbi:thiamine phosphate synthase [Rhodopirellula baltica]|nr:thiamine phosphate synthase [Rhodopirellula baltica]
MRTIEEYGKTIDGRFAKQVEAIRYRSYTVLKDCELKAIRNDRVTRLAVATLYALVDCMDSDVSLRMYVASLCEAGVDIIQLRDKNAPDRLLVQRGLVIAESLRDTNALFIMNDRADLAVLTRSDGVHVGQDELTVEQTRRIVGDELLVGVSTHDVEQVHQAIASGADYIGCGPTFPSKTKSFDSHAGIAFLEAVHRETKSTPRPAFAIGGIDASNLQQVAQAGFHRIAVTAAIHQAADPFAAARELKQQLTELRSRQSSGTK